MTPYTPEHFAMGPLVKKIRHILNRYLSIQIINKIINIGNYN